MTSAAETHYTERMRQLLTVPVTRLRVAGAQHGYQHLTATLADGRAVFAKAAPGPGQAAAFAAAHGGHRETDLAMLALFGAPHLEAILRAYRA